MKQRLIFHSSCREARSELGQHSTRIKCNIQILSLKAFTGAVNTSTTTQEVRETYNLVHADSISNMGNISNLAAELLLSIISDLSSKSILSLSLTNKRLHQATNSKLYKSLYFWGTGNKDETERVFHIAGYGSSLHPQPRPLDASRIYCLDALTRALQRDPSLASQIEMVDLIWDTDDNSEDENKVLRFLEITKHLRFDTLIISPPSLYFQVPAYAPVTTLRTRHKGHFTGYESETSMKFLWMAGSIGVIR